MMPTNPHDLMDCAGNLIDGGPPPPHRTKKTSNQRKDLWLGRLRIGH